MFYSLTISLLVLAVDFHNRFLLGEFFREGLHPFVFSCVFAAYISKGIVLFFP